jgi:hypothetical protein
MHFAGTLARPDLFFLVLSVLFVPLALSTCLVPEILKLEGHGKIVRAYGGNDSL